MRIFSIVGLLFASVAANAHPYVTTYSTYCPPAQQQTFIPVAQYFPLYIAPAAVYPATQTPQPQQQTAPDLSELKTILQQLADNQKLMLELLKQKKE
jgi:hypothetical protein